MAILIREFDVIGLINLKEDNGIDSS